MVGSVLAIIVCQAILSEAFVSSPGFCSVPARTFRPSTSLSRCALVGSRMHVDGFEDSIEGKAQGPVSKFDRRTLLLSTIMFPFLGASVAQSEVAQADVAFSTASSAAAPLLSIIPEMPFGAPATNSTIPSTLAQQIEDRALALEKQGGRDTVKSAALSGSWRLLYTNAREIRNLAGGLPLGFVLGKVYQPVDTAKGYFENQGEIEHMFGLARASNCVIGDVEVAPLGTANAAGTLNTAGNRINVFFRRITFSLDALLGQPVSLRKVIVTRQDPTAAQPANDVTFLDQNTRITRGGDDSLFIFRREESSRPMLSARERQALFNEKGSDVQLFGNQSETEATAPVELKRLIAPRDR